MHRLAPSFEPGSRDVILGRGKVPNKHPGNQHFVSLICKKYLDRYACAPSRTLKSQIVAEIVSLVRRNSPEGGFVKKVDGVYYEVGDHLAREKVSQSLRDLLHTKYKSAARTKRDARAQRNRDSCSSSEEDEKHIESPKGVQPMETTSSGSEPSSRASKKTKRNLEKTFPAAASSDQLRHTERAQQQRLAAAHQALLANQSQLQLLKQLVSTTPAPPVTLSHQDQGHLPALSGAPSTSSVARLPLPSRSTARHPSGAAQLKTAPTSDVEHHPIVRRGTSPAAAPAATAPASAAAIVSATNSDVGQQKASSTHFDDEQMKRQEFVAVCNSNELSDSTLLSTDPKVLNAYCTVMATVRRKATPYDAALTELMLRRSLFS